MYGVKKLYRPASLEEALRILAEHPKARPLAGGTDVVVHMRKVQEQGVELVYIGRLSELKGICVQSDGSIRIGSAVTFTEISGDPVICDKLPCLRTAALAMGGPQIQNVATIGGNVCNGAVSADSAPSLFALDAQLKLQTTEGTRIVSIAEFYKGPGKVDRKPGEILVSIIIPATGKNFGSYYEKFSVRKAMDLAILGTAAAVETDEEGYIVKCGLALGVAAPVPIRCPKAEEYLKGKKPTEEVLTRVGELSLMDASPRDSWRASKRYREALIREISGRVVKAAWENAGGEM